MADQRPQSTRVSKCDGNRRRGHEEKEEKAFAKVGPESPERFGATVVAAMYSVSKPPRMRPIAPPPWTTPYTPNALARSRGSTKVTAIRENAAGASRAANNPCRARAEQHRRVLGETAEGGGAREPDQADQEDPFETDEVGDAACEQ